MYSKNNEMFNFYGKALGRNVLKYFGSYKFNVLNLFFLKQNTALRYGNRLRKFSFVTALVIRVWGMVETYNDLLDGGWIIPTNQCHKDNSKMTAHVSCGLRNVCGYFSHYSRYCINSCLGRNSAMSNIFF